MQLCCEFDKFVQPTHVERIFAKKIIKKYIKAAPFLCCHFIKKTKNNILNTEMTNIYILVGDLHDKIPEN